MTHVRGTPTISCSLFSGGLVTSTLTVSSTVIPSTDVAGLWSTLEFVLVLAFVLWTLLKLVVVLKAMVRTKV